MILICQIAPWDKPLEVSQTGENDDIDNSHNLKVGDKIIIKNEQGTDLAMIIKIKAERNKTPECDDCKECPGAVAVAKANPSFQTTAALVRRATMNDLDKQTKKEEHKQSCLTECEQLIKKHNLPMKLIDVIFHFDGGRITFAFTAANKVDFRELVKDLAKKMHRSIRLYQVGARQEVEMTGDIGPCGQSLCCMSFLEKLGNVTTELIFDQQIAHRGVDRLSGPCGRLKCCLLFEEDNYKELAKNFPTQGSFVRTPHGDGKVSGWKILRQTVMVRIDDETMVEVPISEIKKIEK
ncbi:MAG: regulatory iron-sulfur-containing complex subunit RicT [Patescibacteria group bacterium]|nr:regulatory iron-sulfur-containing complex subunit RicT [Patescibacteria group bacterium]MDD5121585.1 regulatory iron-sulfur-containing complex subunit RicT [Patescibacteria group bacterium]MDD5222295.1 regulatory iron-sulfur-containing complex subunit RicT [Patescibacteria group bacterium]MDD5396251.1 regulatory iron-sulfur-containing complex subunit RicT [Patescibacteria group bacterium]